ncbi:type VI secretion system Vgr family protein [Dyella acidiphila]|uniref:Type VI secretion system tip protein VgrG n=1 Tax=Dyella acidiphila TaxID=2775866 RepID=A0ABR9G8D3_9GAMM|nr:type VI secretion system Vgr family protein [Dyella acidiphila]MBE1160307.1 type VI secretion system tip protein VgrG [Dyella acidiphila]
MEGMDVSAWLGLLSQTTRFITLDAAIDGLIVEQLNGHEAVNDNFRFDLDCVCASAFLDLTQLLGKPLRLGVATADGSRRYWHGYVTHAASLGADGGLARYRVVMESSLAFLKLRRNALIFQDQTALDVVTTIFADYPQVQCQTQVTASLRQRPICTQYRETDYDFVHRLLGEEGLSYRFEHDQGEDSEGAGHTLVIFDSQASLPSGTPDSIRFHRVDATETSDTITLFTDRRQMAPDTVTAASWRPDQVASITGSAQASPTSGAPALPPLEVFEADRSNRFDNADQAQRFATHRLDALRLEVRSNRAEGSVRTLEAGKSYTLTEHPDLSGYAFVPLRIEHIASNNLGTDITHLHGRSGMQDKGSYRNRFTAVPAQTPIAPPYRDKPIAPGCQSAIVVGVPGNALSGSRDHQVRVQFYWQRGSAPLPGGLTDTASTGNPQGHAPGTDQSGTWVRVTEVSAGANHGHSMAPRIGNEVLIEYAHGDIDQPIVVGQLYNGQAAPPFSAGENSSANHPGTLSGMQTQTLDGAAGSQWVLDDAGGQMRHSLSNSTANSQLNLGYLIEQQGNTRGNYRGEGFELLTEGWAVVRAGEGLLLSGTQQAQGASTQMDAAGAVSQLNAAAATAQRLDSAATQAKANGLAANPAQTALQQAIDPGKNGKYSGDVNGLAATKPTDNQRSGGDPVERFAQPVILVEAPQSMVLASSQSAAAFAGNHLHATSQRDMHLAAGATIGAATGDAVSLYTADGGMNVIANHGPVSIEAHTDAMQILADQSVTVTSTTDTIEVLAKDKIVLQAGQSTVTLEGGNITFACPGNFTVKSGTHQWVGPQNESPALPPLPNDKAKFQGIKPFSG